jgi:hypothetical protein
MRKIAPKFPGDGSLGPVDLDNEILWTSKPDELGRISVDLFCREKIRHRSVLGLKQAAERNINRPTALPCLGPEGGAKSGADTLTALALRCNETRSLS